ncbi:Floral homeotic protein APETALA 1 C [Vitis vinifera]|uniref:Floral homeotic protein APETALA 1 C n=1 Tax=Vitis vinifera TaxID=29760 RepID=A0A438E2Y2_VITVI|nr:Floral homeotic protein APETALA 1 C [Vitis vinifera]
MHLKLTFVSCSLILGQEKAMQEQNNMLAKEIKEKEKTVAQQTHWEQQNHGLNTSSFLLPQQLPCLNMGLKEQSLRYPDGMDYTMIIGTYQGEAHGARRNELDLTLEPIYPSHLGCFTT